MDAAADVAAVIVGLLITGTISMPSELPAITLTSMLVAACSESRLTPSSAPLTGDLAFPCAVDGDMDAAADVAAVIVGLLITTMQVRYVFTRHANDDLLRHLCAKVLNELVIVVFKSG